MFLLDDLLCWEEGVLFFLWLLFWGGCVSLDRLWFFWLFLYDFGLFFGLLSLGGDSDGGEGFEVDLKGYMLLRSLDTDGAFIHKAEILDVPLFFDELSEFGETGAAQEGESPAFFGGLIVDCNVDVVAFHWNSWIGL